MPESLNRNPKILGLSTPLSEPDGLEEEEGSLTRLKKLYDQLGTDPDKNIKTLVGKAAGLVGACCSAYYHVVGSNNALRLHASGSLPRNFSRALQNGPCSLWPQPGWFGQPVPFVIEDLHKSTHAKKHAGLLRCGLRSCLVHPVFCDGSLRGLLYFFWDARLRLSRVQFLALSILSKTLCIEEWRWKDSQKKWLDVIESNLHAATLSAAPGPQIDDYKLTPAEIRVAVLIRHRKTSKEISELLGISIRTVEVHRNGIRRKLGIRGKKVNLTTHLMSLECQDSGWFPAEARPSAT